MAKKVKKEIEKKDEILNEPQMEEKIVYEAEAGETEGEGTIGDETLSVEEMKEVVKNNEKDFAKDKEIAESVPCEKTVVKEEVEEKPKVEEKNKIKTSREAFGHDWMGMIYGY